MLKTPGHATRQLHGGWLLFAAIVLLVFWILAKTVNVYDHAITGAIFEIMWLPSLMLMCMIPAISLVVLLRKKCNLRVIHFYTVLISAAAWLWLIFG